MLKIRIIPTLLYKNPTLVKGISFDSWRRVGTVIQAVKVYNMREVDELVFLDITATDEQREPDYSLIDDIADECFMPLTVGGGVRSVDDIKHLLDVGADKVSINTAAIQNPNLINEAAEIFGSQCIVVSIDYKKNNFGKLEVFSNSGKIPTNLEPYEWAREVEKRGAGEILLTSIERDGTLTGYDIDTLKKVSENVGIPVIASGGAGNYDDMYKILSQTKVTAIAAASIFHFTEQTPKEAKKYLKLKGFAVRIL